MKNAILTICFTAVALAAHPLLFADMTPHANRTATERWAWNAGAEQASNVVDKAYVESLGISGGWRDLTNNVCYADSYTAWDFAGAGLTDASLTLEQTDGGSWTYYIDAQIVGGAGIADYVNESGTKAEMENIGSVSVTSDGLTYTIIRPTPAKIASSNEVFTTYGFVTNAVAGAKGKGQNVIRVNTSNQLLTSVADVAAYVSNTNTSTVVDYGDTADTVIRMKMDYYLKGTASGHDAYIAVFSGLANHSGTTMNTSNPYLEVLTLTVVPDTEQKTVQVSVGQVLMNNYTTFMQSAVSNAVAAIALQKVNAVVPSAVETEVAPLRQIIYSWESFLDGSNVVFSITNYYSGVYSTDYAKLRILELRDGVYREVYSSHTDITQHITLFKTNEFRVATNSVITMVNNTIGTKADKDWGKYTSAGGEAPSNTVYMTAPNTVFAGGMEYERVAVGEGAVCILTVKGAPTYTAGDEGTFKFQDDGGTNYFGFAKTDSYTIGCNTDGITVSSGIVTLTYDVTMSGVPCIWYSTNISASATWEQLNTPDGEAVAGASHVVTWEQNPPAGKKICYINCASEAKGFFKATIEQTGEAKFITNMPADLAGGILCTNTATGVFGIIKPSYNGSTVTWGWSAN